MSEIDTSRDVKAALDDSFERYLKERELIDWDMVAAKMELIGGLDTFTDAPSYGRGKTPASNWTRDFAKAQMVVGVWQMSDYEGHLLWAAIQRLRAGVLL